MKIIGLVIAALLIWWAVNLYKKGKTFWSILVGLIGLSVAVGGFYVKPIVIAS